MSTNLNAAFNYLTKTIAALHLSVGIRTMCATILISKRNGRGAAAPHRNCNQRVQQVNVTMQTAISNAQSDVTIAGSSIGLRERATDFNNKQTRCDTQVAAAMRFAYESRFDAPHSQLMRWDFHACIGK